MIQVINRALNILEVIANNSDKELGLSEIADEVELNHGTCANILKTLVNRDYVEQVGTKKGYKLGYMSYQLTNAKSYYTDILSISKSLMDDLRDEINEMVILSIIKSGKRVLLYEAPCNHTLQIRTTQESSIYRATTGRMILAHYSPKELDDLIEKIGLPTEKEWPEVKSKSDLIQYLNQIKTNDVEITLNLNHVVGLATPIYKKGTVIASLGIYLPDVRFGKTEKNDIIKQLKKTTALINDRIAKSKKE
ncbi:MAG: helix-turn-helix domain-containing protein [Parabacteroides sp.]|nr:helix-turn-helix domain-containing protein [Parabacteroides sp.]